MREPTDLAIILGEADAVGEERLFMSPEAFHNWRVTPEGAVYEIGDVLAFVTAPAGLQDGPYISLPPPAQAQLIIVQGKLLIICSGPDAEASFNKLLAVYLHNFRSADITVTCGGNMGNMKFGSLAELDIWLRRRAGGRDVQYTGISYKSPTALPDGSYNYILPYSGCTAVSSDGTLEITTGGASARHMLTLVLNLCDRMARPVSVMALCRGPIGDQRFTALYELDAWLADEGLRADIQEISYEAPGRPGAQIRREFTAFGRCALTDMDGMLTIVCASGNMRDALMHALDWYDLADASAIQGDGNQEG
jgi:hypothetical protein